MNSDLGSSTWVPGSLGSLCFHTSPRTAISSSFNPGYVCAQALSLEWACFRLWELEMKDRTNSPDMKEGSKKQVYLLPVTFSSSPPADISLETSQDNSLSSYHISLPWFILPFSFPLFGGFGLCVGWWYYFGLCFVLSQNLTYPWVSSYITI